MKNILFATLLVALMGCTNEKEQPCQTCITTLIINTAGLPETRHTLTEEVCGGVEEYKKENTGTQTDRGTTVTAITTCFVVQEIKPF